LQTTALRLKYMYVPFLNAQHRHLTGRVPLTTPDFKTAREHFKARKADFSST